MRCKSLALVHFAISRIPTLHFFFRATEYSEIYPLDLHLLRVFFYCFERKTLKLQRCVHRQRTGTFATHTQLKKLCKTFIVKLF